MAFETTHVGDGNILINVCGLVFKTIKLFKNDFTPNKFSVAGDFEEADYSGYAAVDLEFSSYFLNATPRMQVNADSVTWIRGARATSNDIYGIYIVDNGGAVCGYERFPSPVAMEDESFDSVFYQFSPTHDDA